MYISVFITFSYSYLSIKVHLQQKSSIFNISLVIWFYFFAAQNEICLFYASFKCHLIPSITICSADKLSLTP